MDNVPLEQEGSLKYIKENFIHLISQRPVIWNLAHEDHRNKSKKEEAAGEIAKLFCALKTKNQILNEWTSLKLLPKSSPREVKEEVRFCWEEDRGLTLL